MIAAAKSLQLCPTLCDPIDGSPPGSPIPGILQARTLEWVAITFSNSWKWKVKVKSFSHVGLLVTPWTAADQAPPSMVFSRQEYWSRLPLPSPWNEWLDGLKQVTDTNIYFEARNDCKMTASVISCQKTLDILVAGTRRMSLWTGLEQHPLSLSKNQYSLKSRKIDI